MDISNVPFQIIVKQNPLPIEEISKLKSISMSSLSKKQTYETKRGLLIVNNGTINGSGKIIGELGEPEYFNCTNETTLKRAQEWRERRKAKWQQSLTPEALSMK